ncbi:hypothetical protein R1sor_020826 [Riccia sorocarpa]|uniref:Uncharacterized protein n=1 Tax=Riccia sorocarpa TaxID=122646 RepID=A0ABD3GIF5_9MARC
MTRSRREGESPQIETSEGPVQSGANSLRTTGSLAFNLEKYLLESSPQTNVGNRTQGGGAVTPDSRSSSVLKRGILRRELVREKGIVRTNLLVMSEVSKSSQVAPSPGGSNSAGRDQQISVFEEVSDRDRAPVESPKSGGVLRSILEPCKYKKTTPLPPVPLCVMEPTTVVRPLQTKNDIERLKDSVATLGYMHDHGQFFCQLFDIKGAEVNIEDTEMEQWDAFWVAQYKKFENKIRGTEWDFLRRKKLYIWDGNHRWAAWTAYAKENRVLQSHLSVNTTIIDGRETLLSIHFTTMNM